MDRLRGRRFRSQPRWKLAAGDGVAGGPSGRGPVGHRESCCCTGECCQGRGSSEGGSAGDGATSCRGVSSVGSGACFCQNRCGEGERGESCSGVLDCESGPVARSNIRCSETLQGPLSHTRLHQELLQRRVADYEECRFTRRASFIRASFTRGIFTRAARPILPAAIVFKVSIQRGWSGQRRERVCVQLTEEPGLKLALVAGEIGSMVTWANATSHNGVSTRPSAMPIMAPIGCLGVASR